MHLVEPDCRLFYALHPALMWYANEQLGVLPDAFVRGNPCDFSLDESSVDCRVFI